MISVGAYLRKLLFQYDCVVVPELGGFLTHYQPAAFMADTGQFLPPRKRLAFNEALRLDDGILINYIMLHESLSREESGRMISDFVSELKQHVQLAGSFSVEGIGLFTPNAEGKLQFDPELRHNFFGESFGMTAIQAERLSTVALEAVVTEEPTPVYALGPVRQEEILEESPFVRVSRSRPLLRWAAAVVLIGSLGAFSYVSVLEPGQPMESSLNPANFLQVPAWIQTTVAREAAMIQASAASLLAGESTEVVVEAPRPQPAAPVLAAPVTPPAGIAETETKTPAPALPTPEAATTPPAMAAPAVHNATPPAAAPEKKTAPVLKRYTGPLFTVVAGSFANKANALRFRRTLRKAGYSDAYIIQPAQRGQLYKVAAIGSPIREEAIASTDSLKKLTGITPFILRN